MGSKALREVTKALQSDFASKNTLSLPPETRRILQSFVDEHDGGISPEESAQTSAELHAFRDKYVDKSPRKADMFATVLKEMQPAITAEADRLRWAETVAIPLVSSTGHVKAAVEDARDFLVGVMTFDDDAEDAGPRAETSAVISKSLLKTYLGTTSTITTDAPGMAEENAEIAQQVEDVLVVFGRKKPKQLFHLLDETVTLADTRLQALSLLNSFLRHQTPHLYLVVNTPLLQSLLKCLMNDTSTTILSVALTSLIMLLPHIPGSLGPYLPRMFLVYSRLLCWEKFSELSTDAQRDLVTDDRVAVEDEDTDEEDEARDVGIDATWEKARPLDGAVEANTPELRTYFTYLYGLYPLNFLSYVRKPRRFLKSVEFPSADSFDLDQAVIRSRTEQFRQVHLLHSNFYNMTAEEEMVDPKWPKMDPADVVGDCQALCLHSKILPNSPGPPPTGKLPDVPSMPPLAKSPKALPHGQISPVASHTSLRSGTSWRDTLSTAVSVGVKGDSPISKSHSMLMDEEHSSEQLQSESTKEKAAQAPQTSINFLQREVTILRNELNFERWHKAQYSQHIGQIMRRNVKDATVDAETLNLINANRGLKKQLAQAHKAREATIKDSTLTRKQANSLEANMTDRFNKLKLEQEEWQASADELRRLRNEMKQYRDLLVTTEARELNKSHQLELAQRELDELHDVKDQLQNAMQRIHGYEYREFDFETALRERDTLRDEKEMLSTKLRRNGEHNERIREAYATKISELEVQLATPSSSSPPRHANGGADIQAAVRHAIAESDHKLTQLKKAHSRLLEKYTDLEMQLENIKTSGAAGEFEVESPGCEIVNSYSNDSISQVASAEEGKSKRRTSDPARVVAAPLLPSPSSTVVSLAAGVGGLPARSGSALSRNSMGPSEMSGYPPGSREEGRPLWTEGLDSTTKKPKIQPDSNVRVYGRGGAQNIKLKQKANGKPDATDGKKTTGLKAFRIG